MDRKAERNATKRKIVSAAWKLFYERGYDYTTVDDIVSESKTSRGSFYHYFEGKDALLGSLSLLFDEKYEELMKEINPEMGCLDKLLYLNYELFAMVEDSVPLELLAQLYSTQLVTKGEKHLLDRGRTYYRLLRTIVVEGQERGELRTDLTVNEITKLYALSERALLYDWCLCEGSYSLKAYTKQVMPMFLGKLVRDDSEKV